MFPSLSVLHLVVLSFLHACLFYTLSPFSHTHGFWNVFQLKQRLLWTHAKFQLKNVNHARQITQAWLYQIEHMHTHPTKQTHIKKTWRLMHTTTSNTYPYSYKPTHFDFQSFWLIHQIWVDDKYCQWQKGSKKIWDLDWSEILE